jgi:hypothetical protein
MRRIFLAMAILATAAGPSGASEPPRKEIYLTIYGNDPCPKGRVDEIIVCARQPESERYRIPKSLRGKPRVESGPSASWASRVEGLEAAQRFTMPNGCSPVGTNGQTGCTQAMLRQWYLEKRMAKDLVEK